MAGFCCTWIPNSDLIDRPLYEKWKGKDDDLFEWNSECEGNLQEFKKQLLRAPVLVLPDLVKPFDFYIQKRRRIALRVLAKKLGPLTQVVAYFSK